MARKGWDALSPQYRKRLQKAGISKSDYEGGQSLSKARGHERTPEHPNKNINKAKYPTYVAERQRLIREFEAKKQQLWAERPRWNAQRSSKNIRDSRMSNKLLKWALDADEGELIDAIRESAETFRFVGYH
jgi:hypothetical protein